RKYRGVEVAVEPFLHWTRQSRAGSIVVRPRAASIGVGLVHGCAEHQREALLGSGHAIQLPASHNVAKHAVRRQYMSLAERHLPVVAEHEAPRHIDVAERFFAAQIVAVLESGIG